MPAKKKSGRLYIRMDPEIHARVARTAKALGTDINGLLNLILRTGLPSYEQMALTARDPKHQETVLKSMENVAHLGEGLGSLHQFFRNSEEVARLSEVSKSLLKHLFPNADSVAKLAEAVLPLLQQWLPGIKVSMSPRVEGPQAQPAEQPAPGEEQTTPERSEP